MEACCFALEPSTRNPETRPRLRSPKPRKPFKGREALDVKAIKRSDLSPTPDHVGAAPTGRWQALRKYLQAVLAWVWRLWPSEYQESCHMPVGVEEAAQRVPYVIIILTHSKEVATTTGVGRTTTLSSQTDWYTVT